MGVSISPLIHHRVLCCSFVSCFCFFCFVNLTHYEEHHSSLSLSFSLHFNLFPSGSTPLIERVCMAGTKRKKEIDNDTRQHCVENLDLSRTQSVSLSHTHSETQKHTTLSPSMLRFLFNYKNIMRTLLLGCSPHLFKPTVSC